MERFLLVVVEMGSIFFGGLFLGIGYFSYFFLGYWVWFLVVLVNN